MFYAVLLALALTLSACSSSSPSSAPPAAVAPAADPATAASISGTILLEGTVPPAPVIRMDGDPKCVTAAQGEERRSEEIVSSDGKTLGNVFVYLKEGVPQRMYPVPDTPVVLDQQKCRYVPRVLGVQVGQTLQIKNSDALLHNVSAEPAVNQPLNVGQPLQGITSNHVFTTREVMVPLKCQVHSWMRGYVGVLDHPFFAVADQNGRFTLPPLPPGTYTVEAWHEKLGTRTQQITIGPKESKTLDFTFTVS